MRMASREVIDVARGPARPEVGVSELRACEDEVAVVQDADVPAVEHAMQM